MPELTCTARRVGDFESRTEEYELSFAAGGSENSLAVKYLASRAYEISASLDSCVEVARKTISEANLDADPPDTALAQFSWRAMQSVKYAEGEAKTSSLPL